MRLLIIPSQYPLSPTDNSGIFVSDQARTLARDHHVTVLIPRLVTPRSLLRVVRNAKSPPHTAATTAGSLREIEVLIPNLTNRWEWLTHRRWHRAMASGARRLINGARQEKPDIVHAHVVRPAGAVAVELARHWAASAILTEHSGPFSVHLQTERARRATAAAMHGVSSVIAVSPYLADQIRATFPDILPVVVGNVVDESFFSPGRPEHTRHPVHPFRFLFVGGLTWHKGLEYLLDACARLRQEMAAGWQVIIAGQGGGQREIAQQVSALGLSGQVVLLGQQSRQQVRGWMRSSDVLVQPSVIETFGVALIEAMACGVPVIATDCGGPSWLVTHDVGRLIPARDSGALAHAMRDAMRGLLPQDRELIRARTVHRFGRETWLGEMARAYASALKRTQP